ncbi:MAG: 4Fe-4S dicluster domain-containing protein [Thermodesulfobacteriota bacterium]
MNLRIDMELCVRCGACVEHCPGDVLIQDNEGWPLEKYPDDCWYCGVCQAECPQNCIELLFPYLIR